MTVGAEARPILARGGAAGAVPAPVGDAGMPRVPPVAATVRRDGEGGLVSAKLWGQFQGTVYVMCRTAFPSG